MTIEDLNQLEDSFETTLTSGSIRGAMADANATRRDLWFIPVEKLKAIPGFNVRVRNAAFQAHVRNIADSILADGFKAEHPLAGYVATENGENVIHYYDGHCRYEAVQLAIAEGAEIKRLPVVVAQAGTTLEDLTVSLVRSNSGKQLTPYETALVCKRLLSYGWETVEIARRLCMTPQYVNALLQLAAAPMELRRMVIDDRVAARTALDALRDHGENALEFLLRGELLAKSMGKTRVTSKFTPGRVFRRAVNKTAPEMATAIAAVRQDPAFSSLSEESRKQIEDIFAVLEEARTKEEQAAAAVDAALLEAGTDEASIAESDPNSSSATLVVLPVPGKTDVYARDAVGREVDDEREDYFAQ